MKSTINISRHALQQNFRAIQAVAGSESTVLAVVKANAYGHGAALCAPVLMEAGASWFGVSDVVEGIAVRASIDKSARILVMCGMERDDAPDIIAHQLTPVVWTPNQIAAIQNAAEAANVRCTVHLEVETGMTRQGCGVGDELEQVLRAIEASPNIILEGLMSHLCCAEAVDSELTRQQEIKLLDAANQLVASVLLPVYVHLANSSALDEGSCLRVIDRLAGRLGATPMVRPGFALYGHVLPLEGASPGGGTLSQTLEPALTWTTRITDLRDVPAGTKVGYGATFTAGENMRLALLPVGYADGFRRGASSGIGDGWVMIAGQRAPVVGRVSMNLTVVDVTAIDDVSIGAETTLLGDGVSAEDHARWNNTIAYDILCGVRGNRVLTA